MKLLRSLHGIKELSLGSVVSIGNFDGVHRGHQSLLALLRMHAVRLHLPLVVVLFEPQPCEFFSPIRAPARLSRLREKLQILNTLGVDYVYCLHFNRKLADMDALMFAKTFIYGALSAKHVMIGEDFRFGRDRVGDVALLRKIGSDWNATVETCPSYLINNERVSSTRIRNALKAGNLPIVSELLGRTYSMCGHVIHGQKLGRTWGVPTANLALHRDILPLQGIFCVQIKCPGKPLFNGVASIGNRPTINGKKNLLEVYLFDFNDSLYGEMIQVFFLKKLRDEEKFSSMDALIVQIHNDVAMAKVYFNEKRECPIIKIH